MAALSITRAAQEFNFVMRHLPGNPHAKADGDTIVIYTQGNPNYPPTWRGHPVRVVQVPRPI